MEGSGTIVKFVMPKKKSWQKQSLKKAVQEIEKACEVASLISPSTALTTAPASPSTAPTSAPTSPSTVPTTPQLPRGTNEDAASNDASTAAATPPATSEGSSVSRSSTGSSTPETKPAGKWAAPLVMTAAPASKPEGYGPARAVETPAKASSAPGRAAAAAPTARALAPTAPKAKAPARRHESISATDLQGSWADNVGQQINIYGNTSERIDRCQAIFSAPARREGSWRVQIKFERSDKRSCLVCGKFEIKGVSRDLAGNVTEVHWRGIHDEADSTAVRIWKKNKPQA